jgi:hypothetical protein
MKNVGSTRPPVAEAGVGVAGTDVGGMFSVGVGDGAAACSVGAGEGVGDCAADGSSVGLRVMSGVMTGSAVGATAPSAGVDVGGT